MKHNRLKDLNVTEISLVKRGAVPTARVAIAKSANVGTREQVKDPVHPNLTPTRATVQEAMDGYVRRNRQILETLPEAYARLIRTDPYLKALYEEMPRG